MPRRYQFAFDLRHLVSFAAVAERLHFRQAAEALALAQPALSRQVRQLEEAVGAPLLSRTRRKVELTPAGRQLLEQVLPLLDTLQAVPERVRAVAAGEAGVLRVQFTGLAMATVLPALLRRFSALHPQVRIELTESPTSRQLPALLSGEIDLGFFHPDSIPGGIATRLLLKERNGVVLPAAHPLAKRARLALRDLADTPFVLFPRTHNPPFHDRLLQAFAAAGFRPRIADEVWPRANAIGLVRAGLGATFMCPSEAKLLPQDAVFLPLHGPAPESRLVLGWREPAEPAAASFLKTVRGGRSEE